MPTRLPDDRTPEQIGDKVADVLWGYYGQQGIPGTPLTQTMAPSAPSTVYDDAYADTLLAEPAAPPAPIVTPMVALPAPVLPQVTVVVRPAVPVPVPVPAVVPATPRYQVFERLRRTAAVPVPVMVPNPVPVQRAHVVQLGFVDGTTVELPGDHPASRALRSAAAALTLRG